VRFDIIVICLDISGEEIKFGNLMAFQVRRQAIIAELHWLQNRNRQIRKFEQYV
jgi:hypothetical protein